MQTATAEDFNDSVNTLIWRAANAAGRERGRDMVTQLQSSLSPVQFGYAMKAVILTGVYGAYEIGLIQQIAESLL